MATALRHTLLATLSLGTLAATTPAVAQEQPGSAAAAQAAAPANQPEVDAGEEIIVTGTRRTDRTLADSPVPVDVISAEALPKAACSPMLRPRPALAPAASRGGRRARDRKDFRASRPPAPPMPAATASRAMSSSTPNCSPA